MNLPSVSNFLLHHPTLHLWVSHPVLVPYLILESSLAETAVPSLAILTGASLVTAAMRRSAAAARHLVWALALASLLALPVLTRYLPHWRVLPFWWNPTRVDLYSGTVKIPVGGTATTAATVPAEPAAPRTSPVSPGAVPPPSASPYSLLAEPAAERFVEVYSFSRAARSRMTIWIIRVWTCGAALVLGQWGIGRLRRRRLARGSGPASDAVRLELLDDLRRQLGIRRRVLLLLNDRATMPMTWGVLKPVILLPNTSAEWPAGRLRAVLLHELAHTRRGDCLTQGLARIACVLYWFNPLVWIAAYQLGVEQETACDDVVLQNGLKASDYAENLLQIVASLRAPAAIDGTAIPMIRRVHLTDRLQKLLDAGRRRNPLRRATVLVAAIVAASGIAAVAALAPSSSHERQVREALAPIRQAQRRAALAVHNLYLVTTSQEYDWNQQKRDWQTVAPASHKRIWIEAVGAGRWRVDDDPTAGRWIDGPRPYAESRLLRAFDGLHFFEINHGYDEENHRYQSSLTWRHFGRPEWIWYDAWMLPDSQHLRSLLRRLANDQIHRVTVTEVQREGHRMLQFDSAVDTPGIGMYTMRCVFDLERGFSLVFEEGMQFPSGGRVPQNFHRYEVTGWRQLSADVWIPSESISEYTITAPQRQAYRLDRVARFSPGDASSIFEAKDVVLNRWVSYPSTGPSITYQDIPEPQP